jgi:hypothetical protein
VPAGRGWSVSRSQHQEIELKRLLVGVAAGRSTRARSRRSGERSAASATTVFDTDDLALQQSRLSVRLRNEGRRAHADREGTESRAERQRHVAHRSRSSDRRRGRCRDSRGDGSIPWRCCANGRRTRLRPRSGVASSASARRAVAARGGLLRQSPAHRRRHASVGRRHCMSRWTRRDFPDGRVGGRGGGGAAQRRAGDGRGGVVARTWRREPAWRRSRRAPSWLVFHARCARAAR